MIFIGLLAALMVAACSGASPAQETPVPAPGATTMAAGTPAGAQAETPSDTQPGTPSGTPAATLVQADPSPSPRATATTAATAAATTAVTAAVTAGPAATAETPAATPTDEREAVVREHPVPAGGRPHDVAPAPDGTVWYTAQGAGELGRLDPETGEVERIPLGEGTQGPRSAPHGVIVGPDGAAWVTDSGLNAIVRVDAGTLAVQQFPLPAEKPANLNTATFDGRGILWFTGQYGYYGRVDPATGQVEVFDAPGGQGPYGIATTPSGDVYYASLAGSHIARIDIDTGEATVIQPPTPGQGARRVWSDSRGRLWVSEWNAGQLGMYDPAADAWREWKLPGDGPRAYAVYVDDQDQVWVSDFGANTLVRFDPETEQFTSYPLPSPNAQVRQILGRPGEVWGAESGADALVVIDGR